MLAANGASINCYSTGGETVPSVDAGVVTDLAAYPDDGLAPGTWMTCNGTDAVFQDEVEYLRVTTAEVTQQRRFESVEFDFLSGKTQLVETTYGSCSCHSRSR